MNRFDYSRIPDHMFESMKRYIENGSHIGGFLTALFANDLMKTVSNADNTNIQIIHIYVCWIRNHAPIGCMGSYERVKAWQKQKSLNYNKDE